MQHSVVVDTMLFALIEKEIQRYYVFEFANLYRVNDTLEFIEVIPSTNKTTGQTCICTITHLIDHNVIDDGRVCKIASLSVVKSVSKDVVKDKKVRRNGI